MIARIKRLWRGVPERITRRLEAWDISRCQFANDTGEEES